MEILFYGLAAVLTYYFIANPYLQYHREKSRRELEEAYHIFKLRTVRRFYPDARKMGFAELEETYDIEASYQNIGRPFQSAQNIE